MRVYLSGPMTGVKDHNFPAFNAAAAKWREALGVHDAVFNPAESFDGDTSFPYDVYIRNDIKAILECEAIAMLPGWRESRGARLELMIAQTLDLEVFNAVTMQPFDAPTVRTTLNSESEEMNPLFILVAGEIGLVH